jgi:hypothetical protein
MFFKCWEESFPHGEGSIAKQLFWAPFASGYPMEGRSVPVEKLFLILSGAVGRRENIEICKMHSNDLPAWVIPSRRFFDLGASGVLWKLKQVE